jgi:NDP-sugar pyrophosphorylase family protein
MYPKRSLSPWYPATEVTRSIIMRPARVDAPTMEAVVLAAGGGTRTGPSSDPTPKPSLPAGDRPLVDHVLDTAAQAGVDEPNACVRGPAVVGPDAEVGHAVEAKKGILMAGASVNRRSHVGDGVLGPDVNSGADTTVADSRHDDGSVHVTVDGRRVSTGRRTSGLVVGPRTETGIDSSPNAGVTLSVEARTTPGEVDTRDR